MTQESTIELLTSLSLRATTAIGPLFLAANASALADIFGAETARLLARAIDGEPLAATAFAAALHPEVEFIAHEDSARAYSAWITGLFEGQRSASKRCGSAAAAAKALAAASLTLRCDQMALAAYAARAARDEPPSTPSPD
jgi:hypothetical protein